MINTADNNYNSIYLYPAALIVRDSPFYVTTILGSCISVCLYDKTKNTGGINHFMLPLWNGEGLPTPKFGNIAIQKLLDKMCIMGSKKEHLIAKVFGGGEVIECHSQFFNIGKKNINIAFEMLNELGIPVISQSIGGKLGRKIVFNTHTGEVIHRFVKSYDGK
ncbi:MAG: chemotaxis protein CheD [Bacteroidales bacterium]|nr:chemotaxis protein CheD [Bacteroidales bacterium]